MTLGKLPTDLSQPHFFHPQTEANDTVQRVTVSIPLDNGHQGVWQKVWNTAEAQYVPTFFLLRLPEKGHGTASSHVVCAINI